MQAHKRAWSKTVLLRRARDAQFVPDTGQVCGAGGRRLQKTEEHHDTEGSGSEMGRMMKEKRGIQWNDEAKDAKDTEVGAEEGYEERHHSEAREGAGWCVPCCLSYCHWLNPVICGKLSPAKSEFEEGTNRWKSVRVLMYIAAGGQHVSYENSWFLLPQGGNRETPKLLSATHLYFLESGGTRRCGGVPV